MSFLSLRLLSAAMMRSPSCARHARFIHLRSVSRMPCETSTELLSMSSRSIDILDRKVDDLERKLCAAVYLLGKTKNGKQMTTEEEYFFKRHLFPWFAEHRQADMRVSAMKDTGDHLSEGKSAMESAMDDDEWLQQPPASLRCVNESTSPTDNINFSFGSISIFFRTNLSYDG